MTLRKHLFSSPPSDTDTKHFRISISTNKNHSQIQGFVYLFNNFIHNEHGRAILDYLGIPEIIEVDADDDRRGKEVVPITFDIENISDQKAREFLQNFVPEFQKHLEDAGVEIIGCNGYFEVCTITTNNDKGFGITWDDYLNR